MRSRTNGRAKQLRFLIALIDRCLDLWMRLECSNETRRATATQEKLLPNCSNNPLLCQQAGQRLVHQATLFRQTPTTNIGLQHNVGNKKFRKRKHT